MDRIVRARSEKLYRACMFARSELRASGLTSRQITEAVRAGSLLRLRRNRYALADIDPDAATAAVAGGRLACVSVLRALGVFVHRHGATHVHLPENGSRFPSVTGGKVVRHWSLLRYDPPAPHVVSLEDAVAMAVRCQDPRAAVATLDSVAHLGVMSVEQLQSLVATLPRRFHVLARLIDSRCESGPETYIRLILRALGVPYELQVDIADVGRVDFLVDGWLIIECDSRAFHQSWEQQREDRRRDIAAAAQGFVTIRPVASEILADGVSVRDMIVAVRAALAPGARRIRPSVTAA